MPDGPLRGRVRDVSDRIEALAQNPLVQETVAQALREATEGAKEMTLSQREIDRQVQKAQGGLNVITKHMVFDSCLVDDCEFDVVKGKPFCRDHACAYPGCQHRSVESITQPITHDDGEIYVQTMRVCPVHQPELVECAAENCGTLVLLAVGKFCITHMCEEEGCNNRARIEGLCLLCNSDRKVDLAKRNLRERPKAMVKGRVIKSRGMPRRPRALVKS